LRSRFQFAANSNVRCHKLAMGAEAGRAAVALARLSVNNSVLNAPENPNMDSRGNGRAVHAR